MSLREEMWKYEQITGESAEHVPIIKLGAFLDGYEMGIKALEQTRWIPLNAEGNEPKEEGFYLLCLSDGYVTNVYYDGKDWELWLNAGEPIAWQPLPQRYEVESEDAE